MQRNRLVAPHFVEDLQKSVEMIINSGYKPEMQSGSSFAGQPKFSLAAWGRLGFQFPVVVDKVAVFGEGHESVQEVILKCVYHEENDLGFGSSVVVSLKMQRMMPVDTRIAPNPSVVVRGSKWSLLEIRYYHSPANKRLICISW